MKKNIDNNSVHDNLIHKIRESQNITLDQLQFLLTTHDQEIVEQLRANAREIADFYYGKKVFTRGLIEFTNYCKNDCYYCGIRRSNKNVQRYRLTREDILSCTDQGYELGFRTFVLQGGEDAYWSDEVLCEVISDIKQRHNDCAITLSIGERSKESYQRLFDVGADRYLLRHETADRTHYEQLHPEEMSFSNRIQCLKELREIGYEVGCGFMVGSPEQTIDCLYKDLQFIKELNPHMVGIGPFIPQKDTPFGEKEAGTLERTLRLLSIIRLISPKVLLPATTALGTIHNRGREMGIFAGANVVMPNLSPVSVRKKYQLYDNKICTGEEAAECRGCLAARMNSVGYELAIDIGSSKVD